MTKITITRADGSAQEINATSFALCTTNSVGDYGVQICEANDDVDFFHLLLARLLVLSGELLGMEIEIAEANGMTEDELMERLVKLGAAIREAESNAE